MCPPGISLQLPGTDLPEGYTTTFRSVLNLPMSVPTSPPKLPAKGAVSTGVYRNMFVEFGLSKASVQARVNQIFQQLFFGDPQNEAVHYESEDGTGAYIQDIGDNDVRSEGMSYGMMVAVQMGNRTLFDSLWRWAVAHMRHNDPGDARFGLFA